MKILAAFCFLSAGVSAGLFFRAGFAKRVRLLQRLCALLQELENRTAVLHTALPQTVEVLSETDAFCSLTFLKDCAAFCREGLPFPYAWSESVTAFLRAQKIRSDGAQMLPQLGVSLTCATDAQIERLLTMYAQYLQADLDTARQTLQTTGKLDLCLCAAVGILLGIMVL